MSAILFWVILATVAIGVPISFVLFVGPIAAIIFSGKEIFMATLLQRLYSGVNQYPILAIPMFLLAGELLNTGKITERLVDFANEGTSIFERCLTRDALSTA
ncbi:MAG: TRAP transporter large permease subunit [Tropicimonas sp.]|uniref:TRAP transporter large permease subunit n=1 Tax=Tropicimonas sp. TaxID=2067044 RepID=UPI003A87B0F3